MVIPLGLRGGDMDIGNEEKLGELIVYISLKCANDRRFGATKLNKLLYFSDFFSFGKRGKSITEVPYQHLKNGPAPRRFKVVENTLIEARAIAVQKIKFPNGKTQIKTIALRNPDLSSFSGEEIALVDQLIDKHWDDDSDSISNCSHNYVGWKMTKMGEDIPYGSIFLSDEPLTLAEIERGQELASALGWGTA
jgi:hypothetical protein